MSILEEATKQFRSKLESLEREKLLELIELQDPDLKKGVDRIEWVFANKLQHLSWANGEPILERPMTNAELALLIDEPFRRIPALTDMGFSIEEQQKMHVAKDPVLWAREILGVKPRVYQAMMLRYPSLRKVFRAGRRLGKSFCMSIFMLHFAFTTKNGRIIVVTPMKSQAGVLYEEMMKMVNGSQIVKSAIVRNVTSPQYEIQFNNGSSIRFFTSGTKSGGKADVTRGQEAHIIVLDELDYMGPDDLVALYAMLQKTDENQPDKMLVGASTPTGRHEVFYDWCTNPDYGFKEFWFPSYVNPHFDPEIEENFRRDYTEMQYRHEIEADWGENVEGVYPRRFLDRAFVEPPWAYRRSRSSERSFFTMGVDWNKYQAGTNIVLLEVCPKDYEEGRFANKAKLAYREEVPQDEFTYTAAIDRIVKLNQAFDPRHIYVDRGYGEVQVELLHKYGLEHPRSGLRQKVKGVGFKEAIEVPDPYTKQKIRKEMKPFMVENLRRMLENDELRVPANDLDLYEELLGYIVERTSAAGVPVFGAGGRAGDNIHDALALAALAIYENYGDLMQIRYASKAAGFSNLLLSPLAVEERIIEDNHRFDYVDEKYGNVSNAPVRVKRQMTKATLSRSIKRPMF